MHADHPEPSERWGAISDWYAEFASERHWEFLAPMVDFTRWIGFQPFGSLLYPFTSHEFLCVRLRPGHLPDEPLVFARVCPDGQFECGLQWGNGQRLLHRTCPIESARDAFASVLLGLRLGDGSSR